MCVEIFVVGYKYGALTFTHRSVSSWLAVPLLLVLLLAVCVCDIPCIFLVLLPFCHSVCVPCGIAGMSCVLLMFVPSNIPFRFVGELKAYYGLTGVMLAIGLFFFYGRSVPRIVLLLSIDVKC